jgi:GAF domain-containing protein
MGAQLVDIYARADRAGGFPAKVRLAGIIGITSTQAGSIEDTADLIARCSKALDDVLGELKRESGRLPSPVAHETLAPVAGKDAERVLRRFNQVIADVLGQRSVFFGRPEETFARLTEAAAHGLDVPRASIWLYDERRTLIRCADLFERGPGKHTSGVELQASAFPAYFAAVRKERTIAAHDAHTDPRTAEFSKPYLTPLGIGAMLDVPIWVGGAMTGVVCNEFIGNTRRWTADDENFAYAIAGFVALAVERRLAR